jgi:hypothetical protein
MIKPIKVNPLNVTKHTYSECANCGYKVSIYWENRLINTDSEDDMENIQYEPCPKCGQPLGSKEDFLTILKQKVVIANQLCDHLIKVQSTNMGLIKEYQDVFNVYLKTENIDDLKKINGIFFRPSLEGSETDYTTITSVNFNNRNISLGDLIMQIQDLITSIEGA